MSENVRKCQTEKNFQAIPDRFSDIFTSGLIFWHFLDNFVSEVQKCQEINPYVEMSENPPKMSEDSADSKFSKFFLPDIFGHAGCHFLVKSYLVILYSKNGLLTFLLYEYYVCPSSRDFRYP